MTDLLTTVLASASLHRSRPALRGGDGELTYSRLREGILSCGGALSELGCAGRTVGVLLPNVRAFPLAYFGLLAAGARPLLLNPLNSGREQAEAVEDAGAETVLTTRALERLLPAGVRRVFVDGLPDAMEVADASGRRSVRPGTGGAAAPLDLESDAALIFTAAQRGRARGARLTHRNLVANLRSTIEAMRLTEHDRVLAALPLVHSFGLTVTLNAPLAAGAAIRPVERFSPGRLLETFESDRSTVVVAVPSMILGILAAAAKEGVPAHALRVAICGGAPLDPAVQERWEAAFGIPLRQGYGLTEAGPVCLFNRVDLPNRPGTLGVPFPHVEVTVRDESGAELGVGEVGEICIRGENVFPGYLGEDERDPRTFHGEWLRSGDLGTREQDGTFRFRGFLKPMFTRNGFNVYPREVERALSADPRIAEVTVASVPEPGRENDLIVLIRPAPGARLDEDAVRTLCRERLATYKQPARVVLLDEDTPTAYTAGDPR
jgi:long-chain acyl-CoA synthetase